MYDYVVIGGGVESFLFSFFVLSRFGGSKIAFVTKSTADISDFSSVSKVGFRHVSKFEYTNFLSGSYLRLLKRRISLGGWRSTTRTLRKYEKNWLKKRFQAKLSDRFIGDIDRRLGILAHESGVSWDEFLQNHAEFGLDVDLKRKVYRFSNCPEEAEEKNDLSPIEIDGVEKDSPFLRGAIYDDRSFSFNSLKFCRKILNFLRSNGVDFFCNTEISKLNFTLERKLKSVVSSSGKVFTGRNYFIAIGANSFGLNDFFGLKYLTQPILGLWFLIDGVRAENPFKYHHYVNSNLAFCQSYTPISSISDGFGYSTGDNALVVGTGCAWTRSLYGKSCSGNAFVQMNEKLLRKLFPGKKIVQIHGNCIRNFSYNGLPIVFSGDSLNGKYFLISGTGTFTTAASVRNVERAIEFFNS
ncbi:FAD dependent oxidoreductase family protein [Neorickettsia helminthoeca str. Oregon]|uniref:FAD dependent oxidoreductase family protein n=1 Tax=Neorickettsia helminthoeca str. Oregon TaxID=1286528 RepID=X5H356_9RICK|nr:FAD-dependent oxidoreductase [Neorickettsia helminthoeca]AHX10986.1 FAD dependent oxidoreductase family protein [Neorickettsia helminthoeca str. Oregon]